jgi:hypothetical protein
VKALTAYAALSVTAAIVAFAIAMVGLPYGRLSDRAFAELYHGGDDTTGYVHVAIDCDEANPGTQDVCTYHNYALPPSINILVTLGNSLASDVQLSAFGFTIVNPDRTRLDAVSAPVSGSGFDGNPDFNGGFPTDFSDTIPPPDVVGSFVCIYPYAEDDLAPLDPEEASDIGCANGALDGPVIAAGSAHLTLARIQYTTLPQSLPASVDLAIREASAYDETFTEVGSCHPIILVEAVFRRHHRLRHRAATLATSANVHAHADARLPG